MFPRIKACWVAWIRNQAHCLWTERSREGMESGKIEKSSEDNQTGMGERQIVCEGGGGRGRWGRRGRRGGGGEEVVSARSGNGVSQEPCASFLGAPSSRPLCFNSVPFSKAYKQLQTSSLSSHSWKSLGFLCSRFLLLIPLDEPLWAQPPY